MVSPAAFLDKICWIIVGDRYHLWCTYTYCSKLSYPPRISLLFFISLVFPSISSFIKMCIFRNDPLFSGAPMYQLLRGLSLLISFYILIIKFQREDTGNGKLSLRYYFQKCIDKISYLATERQVLTKKSLPWPKWMSNIFVRPYGGILYF